MRLIEVSDKQLLALKAVVHGCNTNQRLVLASYMHNIRSESPEMISYYEAIKTVDKMLEQLTIEAEPVRHGRWIKTDNGIRININTGEPFRAYLNDCSACGWHTGNQGSRFNYCPNCGAKMDGDKHDTEE